MGPDAGTVLPPPFEVIMRKGIGILGASAFLLVLTAGCPADRPDVGLVFDIGGRGDKSFNDLAYAAIERAEKELGLRKDYFEPTQGADRESALRRFAARKVPIIIGVGFAFSDDIVEIAREFPQSKFVCVDYTVKGDPKDLPKNFVGLKYREEEGTFLVGAAAALCTKSKKIGFVGGMDIPLIRKFEAGFRAGARAADAAVRVFVSYAGATPDAFKNPTMGKELALAMYNRGADIIMHASGSTGLGVFAAARETDNLAIGVDADQWSEAPGRVLTSMLKKIDVSLMTVMKEIREGRFRSGVRYGGLKEGFIDYVWDDNNRKLFPEDVRGKVEEFRKRIVSGDIQVPTRWKE
jgi:basic membrane protein A